MIDKTPRGNLAKFAGILKHPTQLILLICVFALLALYFLSVPLALELFLFEDLSTEYSPSYPIKVQFFHIQTEVALGFVFVFLTSLYMLCFVLAWKQKIEFHKVLGNFFAKAVGAYMKNSLFALPVLSSLTYIAVDSIHALQESRGIPIGKPPLPEDPLLAFFGLCVSPLAEEITYRILPLGVFLAVRLLTLSKDRESSMSWKKRLKVCLTAFLSPEDAKREFGLKTVEESGFWSGIGQDEWVMILFTTVFFALSHYFFTSTWNVGKISSTFVQGFIWGLAYLAYGIQAPVLLHWFFNLYLYTYGLAAIVHPNLSFLTFLNQDLTFGLGILALFLTVYWGARELARAKTLNLGTLLLSVGKIKTRLSVRADELLSSLRRMDLFDVAAVVLTLIFFSMRLAIVNFPSPQVGDRYYETGFVFDESYYVKAARKMLVGEPSNNEHPPLAKALILLGIILFGDNPAGWRIFPIVTSSISVLLVYRTALLLTKRKVAALSASLLFATDVTAFNIGQIGMLDGSSLMFALVGTALFLSERYDLGGLFLGLSALCKLSAIFAAAGVIFFFVLARLTERDRGPRFLTRQVRLLGRASFIVLVTFLIGLWVYDAGYQVFNNNPLGHIIYMYSYHDRLRYNDTDNVILPLQWINPLNPFPPIPYHITTVREVLSGTVREYHPIAYYGLYTPLWWSIWLIVPICLLEVGQSIRKKQKQGVGLFALSWIAANFLPLVLLAYLKQRWVYPFYFYMSLPGLYIALSHYPAYSKHSRIILALLIAVNLLWFIVWFPVKPKPVIDLLLLLGLPA